MATSDQPGNTPGDDRAGKAGFSEDHGPELSVETLALLHADALEGAERDRAKAQAAADPAAQAVLAGLDMVCAQLRRLDHAAPPAEQMPEFLARRMDRELAKLSETPEARRRRWTAAASVGSVAAAAAVLSLVTYAAWPRQEQDSPQPQAQPEPSAAQETSAEATEPLLASVDNRFTIERKDFSTLLRSGGSFKDLGPLSDEAIRGDCLAANGFPADQQLVAAGRIKRGDKEGIFMMIPTPAMRGGAPGMTVLVVGSECRAGIPATLSKQVLSRN
ncbi:conserved hypothetical protein [Segniliparus rotundus DSM 44985]|uniref:Uncharacterized protein n=1 Tax=Segniliparus rotundus (strain ATCC BAA-972 / CDC 1076 / CIP 108378 / DSM 44985 / JCM 13578) TaxID=640132 RepID=D6Z9H9_SEGRD|nr:hypothetical protein [Segniliparus rotundus]ADG96506.1 conserved hypothetical protein [Segniliparus rotundus DSM 44985]